MTGLLQQTIRSACSAWLRWLNSDAWKEIEQPWTFCEMRRDTMHIVNAHQYKWCVDCVDITLITYCLYVFCKPRGFLWDSSWSSPAYLRLGSKQHDLIFNFLSPFVVLTLVIKTCHDRLFGLRRTHRQIEQGGIMRSTHTQRPSAFIILYLSLLASA